MNKQQTELVIRDGKCFITARLTNLATRIDFEVDVTGLVQDLLNKPWLLEAKDNRPS